MTEPNAQNEKPRGERRLDPELHKKGLRCDQDQLDMLKRCSDKKDMTEWREWRNKNLNEEILLEGADFSHWAMKKVNLMQYVKKVSLKRANFVDADLEESLFMHSDLDGADFEDATLSGALLSCASLKGANFILTHVDGITCFWNCKVDHNTDFSGVPLDVARIDPATKQLLEYNIRRMNWEDWYWKSQDRNVLKKLKSRKETWLRACRVMNRLILTSPVRLFWLISDYGLRTWRIIFTFFGLAFGFGLVYWLFPSSVIVNGTVGDIRGLWHALYFSVVTMTTLGFGDIAANPDSWVGQTLLMVQVILGYVLLGALVTRFAVLFTAGGPAGTFAKDRGQKTDDRNQKTDDRSQRTEIRGQRTDS